MIFVGVDPGKEGAIAGLDQAGDFIQVEPIPLVSSAKGRDEFDLPGIVKILAPLKTFPGVFVTIEKLHPLPRKMGGSAANFARGLSRGWEWMLVALSIPYLLASPQTWQRVMLAGTPGDDTGQRAILAAKRLFPGVDLHRTDRSRKDSDGMADALLIAEFGRRVHMGGDVFAAAERGA